MEATRVEAHDEYLLRLSERLHVVATARKKTRYGRMDRIDDASLLRRLPGALAATLRELVAGEDLERAERDDQLVAPLLAAVAGRLLREQLVATLVEDYGLERVAAEACEECEAQGHEAAAAYCLVVLCQKTDRDETPPDGREPQRHYGLDVGADGFAERLAWWARTVARHLASSAEEFRAIVAEAEQFELTRLRALVSYDRAFDDVADALCDHLADVLMGGPRLEDMSLATAVAIEPVGGAYVFQSPLRAWVRTSANNARPYDTDAIDGEVAAPSQAGEAIDDTEPLYERHVRWLAELRATRDVLQSAIDFAERIDQLAAEHVPDTPDDAKRFGRFRAALMSVVQELAVEQSSFDEMLSYLAQAMKKGERRRVVAILSLRSDSLDEPVVEHIAGRLRAIAASRDAPKPQLVMKVDAALGEHVPQARLSELHRLRDDSRYRATATADRVEVLDSLPARVSDLASIGAAFAKPMKVRTVIATRGQARRELAAVDKLFETGFWRYARKVR